MRRDLAMGAALDDAFAGRKVLYLAKGRDRARFLAEAEASREVTVRRTNGNESASFPSGGSVTFRILASTGHRGLAVDSVYVESRDPDVLADVTPCVATSTRGRLVIVG